MSFESALRQGGPRVGAWDYNSDGKLCLYSVGRSGAKPLGSVEVSWDEREEMNEKLLASGARIGGTHSDAFGNTKYVWAMDEDGAHIWTDVAPVVHLTMENRFTRVRTFFDVADPGHRGVAVETPAGKDLVIVEEHDPAGKADPTYNADSLSSDIEWAFYIGRDLAMWRAVPHYDQLTDSITNLDHLRIRKVAFDLASDVEHLPDLGAFDRVVRELGPVGKAADLTLYCAADPVETNRRRLEIRVTSASGKSSVQRIKQGSNKEVAAFLRRAQTPSAVLRAMNTSLHAH